MKKTILIVIIALSLAFNILAALFYLQVFVQQGAYRQGATQALTQVLSVVKEKGSVELVNGNEKIILIPQP